MGRIHEEESSKKYVREDINIIKQYNLDDVRYNLLCSESTSSTCYVVNQPRAYFFYPSPIMTTYTSGIVKQWACDTIFAKNKPAKDIQTAFQSCALAKAFTILTRGKLMKREEKWRQLSENAKEQTLNFMTFNFAGVNNIPA